MLLIVLGVKKIIEMSQLNWMKSSLAAALAATTNRLVQIMTGEKCMCRNFTLLPSR